MMEAGFEGSEDQDDSGDDTAPNQQPRAFVSSGSCSTEVALGSEARKSQQKPQDPE